MIAVKCEGEAAASRTRSCPRDVRDRRRPLVGTSGLGSVSASRCEGAESQTTHQDMRHDIDEGPRGRIHLSNVT